MSKVYVIIRAGDEIVICAESIRLDGEAAAAFSRQLAEARQQLATTPKIVRPAD